MNAGELKFVTPEFPMKTCSPMTTTTLMKKPIATRSFAALPKAATTTAMTGISAAFGTG